MSDTYKRPNQETEAQGDGGLVSAGPRGRDQGHREKHGNEQLPDRTT